VFEWIESCKKYYNEEIERNICHEDQGIHIEIEENVYQPRKSEAKHNNYFDTPRL
jgi:hypothetical protein